VDSGDIVDNSAKTTVVSLCDRTGNMVVPWLEAAFQAITVDLEPAVDNFHWNRRHIRADVDEIGGPANRGYAARAAS
jgi:hypothetical protein